MPRPLTEHTKSIVRATVPVLAEHGAAIAATMYDRLFQNEDVKALFNQSNQGGGGRQTHALANALVVYGQNIDNLEVLTAAVERISHKHASLRILPEHYPHVANALMRAIKDVLGAAATEAVLEAWGEAYWFLAEILMAREKAIYSEQSTVAGGWDGWRDFVVESKQPESSTITSFVLRPADGNPVSRHLPGQYITLQVPFPGKAPQRRNYSISSGPNGQTYRISVKRESHGLVSRFLHDDIHEGNVLSLAPPSGDFFFASDSKAPVVFLSGGVGLTPMVSMLESIVETGCKAPLFYVHATRHGDVHAMGQHVRALADTHPEIKSAVFYTSPRGLDEHGKHYDHQGRIDIEWLAQNTPLAEADFYVCGPDSFLSAMVEGLISKGVDSKRIRYEFFGPAAEFAS